MGVPLTTSEKGASGFLFGGGSMHKSPRYDYNRRPYYEKPNKDERKKRHKTFRAYEKQIIAKIGEFEPMSGKGGDPWYN